MYFVTKAAALLMMAMTASAKSSPSLRGITQDVQEEFDSFVDVMEKRKDEKDLLAAYADVLDYYMYPEDSEDSSSEDFDSEDYDFEEKKKGKKGGKGGGGNMGCAQGWKWGGHMRGCVPRNGGHGHGGYTPHSPYVDPRYDGRCAGTNRGRCDRKYCQWINTYGGRGTCIPGN